MPSRQRILTWGASALLFLGLCAVWMLPLGLAPRSWRLLLLCGRLAMELWLALQLANLLLLQWAYWANPLFVEPPPPALVQPFAYAGAFLCVSYGGTWLRRRVALVGTP